MARLAKLVAYPVGWAMAYRDLLRLVASRHRQGCCITCGRPAVATLYCERHYLDNLAAP